MDRKVRILRIGGIRINQKTIVASAEQDAQVDEELIDTLITISVIAKRLAKKLSTNEHENQKGGNAHE